MKKFAIPEGTRDLILGECSVKKALQKEKDWTEKLPM